MADLTINENTYIGFTANQTEAAAQADKTSNRVKICKNRKLYLNGQRLGLTDEETAALQAGLSGGSSGGSSGGGTDYSSQINELKTTVDGHTNTLSLLQSKNNEQDTAIASKVNQSTYNNAISDLAKTDSDLQGAVNSNASLIEQLQADVATLRNTVEAGGGSGSGGSEATTDAAQLNAEITVLEQCLLGGALVEFAGIAPEGSSLYQTSTTNTLGSSCPVYFVPGTNGGFGALSQGTYYAGWTSQFWPVTDYNPSSGMLIAYATGTSTVYLFRKLTDGWTYTQIGATDKATFNVLRGRYATAQSVLDNAARIVTLENRVTNLENYDTDNEAVIQNLLNSVEKNEDSISSLSSSVGSQATSIGSIQTKNTQQDNRLTQLEADVAALKAGGSGSSGSSGSTDGVAAEQLAAEITVLEQCLLGGALVEFAGFAPEGSSLYQTTTTNVLGSSCPVYFVPGTNGGFGALSQGTYYSGWVSPSWPMGDYNPSSGMLIAYATGTSTVYLFKKLTDGWTYTQIGATDKATFDAIKARYTLVNTLRTTVDGHGTRIATLETDVAALQAGSGGSGSGSTGTAEVLTVDAAALDSLCPDTTTAKSLFQHPEKMRYVVTVTSGGVTICVGELVMYADAGGKQITQELRSHYFITGNVISSSSIRLDAMNTFVRTYGILSNGNTYSTEGAWTYWRPKDGILNLGESDVNTYSYMQDNVPSALKLPLICGNKYITRIVFTVTKDSVTHSGIVDQQVSNTTCMQRLHMDSRLFTRFINFTNGSRTIVSGSPQTWQYSEARNLDYNKTSGLLKLTNMWGNNVGSSVKIPESDDSFPGLVPKGTLSKFNTLMAAQQRTWALNEPALQFDFFEKHPKDVDGTIPVLRGYGTSFRLCSYDASDPQNISWEDINQNVFFHMPAACPSTYTYNGVTYDHVSRYFALFRKYKRTGKRKYKKIVGNNYKAKRKQGYIEYLRTHGNVKNYGIYENAHNTAGEMSLMNYMDDFPNIFCKKPNKSGVFSHGTTQNLQNKKDGNSGFTRTVSRISIGICLLLKCEKEGQKPLFVYGPLLKGHLLSIHITSDDNPHGNPRIADMYFKRA
jgi:hypothetical protein